jgi:hypothetical protein
LDYDDVLMCEIWETLVEGGISGTPTRVCLASTTITTVTQTSTTTTSSTETSTTTSQTSTTSSTTKSTTLDAEALRSQNVSVIDLLQANLSVDELVSKGFAASELLDAGVSCADVERQYGKQKSACADSIGLIVAIVVIVLLLVAAVGGLVCVRQHKRPYPPVAERQQARPSVLQHGTIMSNPMFATVGCSDGSALDGNFNFLSSSTFQHGFKAKVGSVSTRNTPRLNAFSEPTYCNNDNLGDRSQPSVFVSGAKLYLIPVEGDSSGSSQIYVEPSLRQPALYDAAKQPRENQAAASVLPLPNIQPTYAVSVASTKSIEIYTDATGNSFPMFVEHIDGGYSQVQGGQVYVEPPRSAKRNEGVLVNTLETDTAAEANSNSTENCHSISLGDQAQLYDLASAALDGTGADGARRVRVATDWSNSSEQTANAKPPSLSDSGGGSGGMRTARSGSVYAGFADAVTDDGSAA